MKISQHYKLHDATYSYTAEKKGIDNTQVSDFELERIIDVAEYVLEPIYEKHGRIFAISSWFRCPELNKAVGGVPASEHTLGSAVDLVPLGLTAYELACKIRDSKAVYNKLILERRNGREWVHVQFRMDCLFLKDCYTYFGDRCCDGLHNEEPKEAA